MKLLNLIKAAYKRLIITENQYYPVYFCKACDANLTYRQIMYSHGCCPKCGNISRGTVVDYVIRAVK